MANFNLDRIRFKWRSTWVAATVYTKDDIVYYNGKAYVCLIGHTSDADDLTTDLLDTAPKWELMFDGYVWRSNWDNTTYYTVGDIVKFEGYVYRCVTSHTSTNLINFQLPADIAKWEIFATTYNWLNKWTLNFYYDLGDVVKYNGTIYICSTKHQSSSTPEAGLEANQASWTVVAKSDSWQYNWVQSTRYVVNDIVKYGAITYRCIVGHKSATTLATGLEADQAKWEIVTSGIEYKFNWTANTRYKLNDIVKSGNGLWIATVGHTSSEQGEEEGDPVVTLRDDEANWNLWLPGTGYEGLWSNAAEYQKGDIVLYGGYTYTALTNNLASVPSVNGIVQDTGDWELLKTGYKHRGEWSGSTAYLTGDVIRNQGHLYVAIADSTGVYPDLETSWTRLVPGHQWRAEWIDNTEYFLGDVVTYAGVNYTCIQRHLGTESDNRPDLDIQNTNENYWIVLLQGTPSNVLTNQGDLRVFGAVETERSAIGAPGTVLKSSGVATNWQNFEVVRNVFYVSIQGLDTPQSGKSLVSPFRTIAYAMEFILADVENRTPATVFVKTGVYEEVLPISIPADVALVGDELRSTVIMPASGYEESDMFYMRNGSGLRNCTLSGLAGTLPAVGNNYGTRFPTGGAFVSLDPGTGPTDTSVHIINKSPYVQNVSTFGTACIGMKIDGTLHASGNKSIVANDFTQIISDGIGYWANEAGRSELVSVFTYFCYIGYYATNGGILRATNGNNSYGTFGSRAEGYSLFETPITAQMDNQTGEAQVEIVHTNGSELVAIGYSHAGQSYTNAVPTIIGTGISTNIAYDQFRNNAISQVRVIDPADSSTPGGLNYQYLLNAAQSGDNTYIQLAASDTSGTPLKYVGMRIVIVSGKGVGQYAKITGYDELTKVAVVSKEYNGTNGWENLYPGRPISNVLDSTTRYSLEPSVIIDDPGFSVVNDSSIVWPAGFTTSGGVNAVKLVAGTYIAIGEAGASATSADGITFTTSNANLNGNGTAVAAGHNQSTQTATAAYFLSTAASKVHRYTPSNSTWVEFSLPVATNGYNYMAVNPSTGFHVAVDTNGDSFATFNADGATINTGSFTTINGGTNVSGLAYGHSKWVIIEEGGAVAYSVDDAATWTETLSVLPAGTVWKGLAYGNGRFVAIGEGGGEAKAAYSFDAVTWYTDDTNLTLIPNSNLDRIVYANGEFIAQASNGSTVAKTKDGWAWQWFADDSTAYTLASSTATTTDVVGSEIWSVTNGSSTVNKLTTGAGAVARAIVTSSRVQSFIVYDPGANYQTTPGVFVYDPDNTSDVDALARTASGVLPQPVFVNRGSGYVTATVTIAGDGFADIYQSGKTVRFKNLTLVPGPGANVVFSSINDVIYRLTKIVSQSGVSPNIDVTFEISPPLTNQNAPEHEESVILRELYSQIRLTGHDFLDIGVGNIQSTDYPALYVEGYNPAQVPEPFNEVTQFDGGRVFYTSTDQDGNFRVGELFAVEQNTGIVSINADFFELSGLTELSLGAIQVGGSAVIIREFSKEPTFIANSNNIVPTQAAIIKYLEARISGGGADAVTNTLFAGQVKMTGNSISTSSGLQINIPVQVNMTKGVDGDYLAHMFFRSNK